MILLLRLHVVKMQYRIRDNTADADVCFFCSYEHSEYNKQKLRTLSSSLSPGRCRRPSRVFPCAVP